MLDLLESRLKLCLCCYRLLSAGVDLCRCWRTCWNDPADGSLAKKARMQGLTSVHAQGGKQGNCPVVVTHRGREEQVGTSGPVVVQRRSDRVVNGGS